MTIPNVHRVTGSNPWQHDSQVEARVLWAPAARLSAPWCMLHIGMSSRHAACGLHPRSAQPVTVAASHSSQVVLQVATAHHRCSTHKHLQYTSTWSHTCSCSRVHGDACGAGDRVHSILLFKAPAGFHACTHSNTANGLMWNSLPARYTSSMRLRPGWSLRPACRGPGRPPACDGEYLEATCLG